jgi:hypothetical protein
MIGNFTISNTAISSVYFPTTAEEIKRFFAFGVSGKIGKPGAPDPWGVNGIWQMRMTRRGKVPIKEKFYVPYNPQTEAQQANRQKFADAMAAWQALTTEQKAEYNARAKRRQMFGWGLFIREYYQANL